jgi:hypothetical protein
MERLTRGVKWRLLLLAAALLPALAAGGQDFLVPIPVGRVVTGAFGSEWKNELWVYNGGSTPITLILRPALAGRELVVPPQRSSEIPALDDIVAGRPATLHVESGNDAHIQLQVRELTSGDVTGVVVPTVSLDRFSTDTKHLLDIRLQKEYRTTLRIFALFSASGIAGYTIRAFDMNNDTFPLEVRHVDVAAPLPLPPTYVDNSVGFSIVSDLAIGAEIAHARVEITADEPARVAFWAFASVTNNRTQSVLVVAP